MTRSGGMIGAAGLLAIATPAFAHPGDGAPAGFMAGLIHPLTGPDHLGVMLMVGLWSGLAFPRRWWVCPAAFAGCMIAGFGYGAVGGVLPGSELLILASLVMLGAMLATNARPPLRLAVPALGLIAIAHGFAHGQEARPDGGLAGFAAGFVIATVGLHAAGLGLARLVVRRRRALPPRIQPRALRS